MNKKARRHSPSRRNAAAPAATPTKVEPQQPAEAPSQPARVLWTARRTTLVAVGLVALHLVLAWASLAVENPTVDEVLHLPAGISYWQTGSFRLYHHNPPLVKLIAALPVAFGGCATAPLYNTLYWRQDPPNKAGFGHEFAGLNAPRYFEIFFRARLLMPLFSIVGAWAVCAWSRALYGNAAGLLSLALWCLCPNILAHARLITTDVAAASLGVASTYLFWRYLKSPTWRRAAVAGVALGLAELTKFSLILLYGLWPMLAALHWFRPTRPAFAVVLKRAGHALAIVGLSVLAIDACYGFEGVGIPLGTYEFVCGALTRPARPDEPRPSSPDAVTNAAWHFRVNRFRGTPLAALPVPLPKHYVLGFDDQKLEAEGLPRKFTEPNAPNGDEIMGYPTYLDGELSQTSRPDYYLKTLLYKVPEGTWVLIAASFVVLTWSRRARAGWADETTVVAVPLAVLAAMSLFTNIDLGLRYVLPTFPFLFVAAGKCARYAAGCATHWARVRESTAVAAALAATAIATATINPHFLSYFNLAAGGPDHGAEHLIDSNLDWGQDLVGLRAWLAKNAPGERVGIAYFGQINPSIFAARGEGIDWFLPPPAPGTIDDRGLPTRWMLAKRPWTLEPGLYAVSASLVKGLPWRVYDADRQAPYQAWFHAFSYFGRLRPVAKIGYSIWIYRVDRDDAARLSEMWK